MLRYRTAGESHGQALVVVVEGLPAGLEITVDEIQAEMARRHNDANVVTLAGRRLDPEVAERIVERFLGTDFEGGRHERRVDEITEIERG